VAADRAALTPFGVETEKTMLYGEHNWTQIPDLTDKVAVVPLGSIEQHGHHLPLLTDTMTGAEIARRAEKELGDTALFLPMLFLGASDHHLGFPGTVSLHDETYTRVISDILESLIGAGFCRIVLLNAHGGNARPASAAMYEVEMRHRDQEDLWLVLATWYTLAAPYFSGIPGMVQDHLTHSCEMETSLVLYLRPDLVQLDAARGRTEPFSSQFYALRGSRVTVQRSFDHVSETGAMGHPEAATPEKGKALIQLGVEQVVACIREIASWPPIEPR
jgi:creatinine amidohydrolase